MNCTSYIFGELAKNYTQYPEDSSSTLFKDIQSLCIAPAQLIIHRDENLMYYIYVRKFDNNKYIGFAIVINGYYLTQIQPIISSFEKAVEDLLERGIIMYLNETGEITSELASLSNEEEEVMSVVDSLQTMADHIDYFKSLPPTDYSVSISSRIVFNVSESLLDIIDASYRYGFTIILKEHDYDSLRVTSFKNVIKQLNAEKDALIEENEELKEANRTIQNQKKQIKKVTVLILSLIVCGGLLYFLYLNLNDTQKLLYSANQTITEKESLIEAKDAHIYYLRDSVNRYMRELNNEIYERKQIENSLDSICSYYPFAITNCEVDAYHFKFDYYCLEEKEVTVTLKAIDEKYTTIVTNNHTLTFFEGAGSKSLDFSHVLSTTHYYYVVLIYNGHIIAGKYW